LSGRVSRWDDRYGQDVLAKKQPSGPLSTAVRAELGLVVEDAETGWVGSIVRVEKAGGMLLLVLEDRHGKLRSFRMGPGFLIDGEPVRLIPASERRIEGKRFTASGSLALGRVRARQARRSRIWVEGKHDAELVARVWGEDLALEGVVVEELGGVEHLPDRLEEFAPQAADARLGVLVDHLIAGSKEQRIAQQAASLAEAGSVLIVGHPFVDIWQAIKPSALGLAEWPTVPVNEDWKTGVLKRLGQPVRDCEDIGLAWHRMLSRVRDFRDLEPALLGPVEALIDFVLEAAE
jgi:hypothetical protein